MRRPCHLLRRHNVWSWRRRIPAAVAGASTRGRLVLSLGTSDLRAASQVGYALDAVFEELLAEGTMDAETLARVLARVRDDALAAGHAKRIRRPADQAFSPAIHRRVLTDIPEDEKQAAYAEVISALTARGEVAVSDDDLIDNGDDPAVTETTGGDPAGSIKEASRSSRPPLRTPLAASRDRSILLSGVAGFFAQSQRRNDVELAQGPVDRALKALQIDASPADRQMLEHLALAVLAEAHGINARRETGDMSGIAALPMGNASIPAPEPPPAAPPTPTPPPSAAPQAESLKLFSQAWKEYRTYRMAKLGNNEPWTRQTANQNEKSKELWIEFHGDRPLDQYEDDDAEEFKEALQFIPRFHGKNPDLTAPMRDMVARTRDALDAGKDIPDLLSVKTIKRHMSALSGFYQWLSERKRAYGYRGQNIFRGFKYKKGSSARGMWHEEDLTNLFTTPIWTGRDPYYRARPGPDIIYNADYWLPLLAVYHGLRQEEIAQLRAQDIRQVFGIWCIDVNNEHGRVKTQNSIRIVPMHKRIIALGFLEYADLFRGKENDHLWPTLKQAGPDGKFATYYARTFCTYCRQVKIYNEGRPFHALRATFRTFLEETEAKSVNISQVLGQSLVAALGVGGLYVKRSQVMKLQEVVDLFDPGIDLSHLRPFDPLRNRIE